MTEKLLDEKKYDYQLISNLSNARYINLLNFYC